jgi:hypothetical protein
MGHYLRQWPPALLGAILSAAEHKWLFRRHQFDNERYGPSGGLIAHARQKKIEYLDLLCRQPHFDHVIKLLT